MNPFDTHRGTEDAENGLRTANGKTFFCYGNGNDEITDAGQKTVNLFDTHRGAEGAENGLRTAKPLFCYGKKTTETDISQEEGLNKIYAVCRSLAVL